MKLRLALPSLPARFQGPLRFGRRFRGHELALRMFQLLALIVLGGLGAKLLASSVALLTRTIAGLVS